MLKLIKHNNDTHVSLPESSNPLFMDPDPDAARLFFKTKSRALVSKITTVKEAVSELVQNGDYIAIGGFGTNRIPTAVLHEMVRQKKTGLGFAGHTSTHDFQILVAGNCLSRVDAAYIVGLEARGLSPSARRAVEKGTLIMTEWTNATLAWRIKAAAMGLSFLPSRSLFGTDTFTYSAAKTIECPFTGKGYTALPALFPDVAVIHVHECDIFGNARVKGVTVADQDLAKAAKRVIMTTEAIIPNADIRKNPEYTFIPYWCVDAVIHVPFGSYPGNMPGLYFSDEPYLKTWLDQEKNETEFQAFFTRQILETENFMEFLVLNGGMKKLSDLEDLELLTGKEGGL
jgi:glutaconate CoA-transferase subunit A